MSDGTDKDDEALNALQPGVDQTSAAHILDKPAFLRLLAEDLSVEKETVETARVHVSTHTVTHEALVDEC